MQDLLIKLDRKLDKLETLMLAVLKTRKEGTSVKQETPVCSVDPAFMV